MELGTGPAAFDTLRELAEDKWEAEEHIIKHLKDEYGGYDKGLISVAQLDPGETNHNMHLENYWKQIKKNFIKRLE